MEKIIIGSRGSRLALAQTNWIKSELEKRSPHTQFEIKIISTKGDQILNVSLDKIGDKGLFVKEIEQQLLDGQIDMAVHSMKDMPSTLPEGLVFSKTPIREDARDVLILKEGYTSLADLPKGAKIGTGSKRRLFQLKKLIPDFEPVSIRGNIETRMGKIESEGLDAVVLAAAGLHRLDLSHRIGIYLTPSQMLPAPAQGALAIEYPESHTALGQLLDQLGHDPSHQSILAERSFLEAVNGSCHIPIGAHATIEGDQMTLDCLFGDEAGNHIHVTHVKGKVIDAESLGIKAADQIKAML